MLGGESVAPSMLRGSKPGRASDRLNDATVGPAVTSHAAPSTSNADDPGRSSSLSWTNRAGSRREDPCRVSVAGNLTALLGEGSTSAKLSVRSMVAEEGLEPPTRGL